MSTETIARPAETAAPKPTEFTTAEHAMLDAMNVPADRRGRALLFREMQRTGLDPFAKHLYLREDWNQKANRNVYTVSSTIAGFEIVAARQPTYEGQTAPQWCDKNGKWFEVWLADGPPVAARIGVYVRGYREPMWGIARFNEYKPGGNAGFMWSKMAAHMIAKVAEALAIRKAYPDQLSGVYTDDEMQQADARNEEQSGDKAASQRHQRRAPRANDEWNQVPPQAIAEQQDRDAEAPQEAPEPPAPGADPGQLASILAALQARGINDRGKALAAISKAAGRQIGAPAELTADEVDRVLSQLTAPLAEPEQQAEPSDEPRQYKMRMMFALIKKKGHTKDGAYALASQVFKREITSANQLTSDEVDAFIKLLDTGELPKPSGPAPVEQLAAEMRAAQTSDELADVSERMWRRHEAGEITQADVSKIQDVLLEREGQLVQAAKAAA